LCVVAVLILFTAPVDAQQPAAVGDDYGRVLFESGKTAYLEGRYEAALSDFRLSFELSQRSQLQYNWASSTTVCIATGKRSRRSRPI